MTRRCFERLEEESLRARQIEAGILHPAAAGVLEGLAAREDLAGPRMVGCHLLDGAGHWVQQEQPDEVNRLLLQFLKANDAPRLPILANIGVVDSQSPMMGEVLSSGSGAPTWGSRVSISVFMDVSCRRRGRAN